MNIAVMAPHVHGNGRTTIAALIAAELSLRNRPVCITNARSISESLYPYFSLKTTDESNNPEQLVNLIKGGGITKSSIPDYCRNIADHLDMFSLNTEMKKGGVDEETMTQVIKFIGRNAPYDYIVYDVDENDIENPLTKAVVEEADCIVLILTQAITEINRFKKIKNQFISKTKRIPIIVVVNKYMSLYGSLKEVGTQLAINNTKEWKLVHYNPHIPYCENQGKLLYLFEQIQKRNADVIELDNEIKHIIQSILRIKRDRNKK